MKHDPYKLKGNYKVNTYKSKDEWKENRKGIGGSDIAAVIDLNPYKTSNKLYREKKGLDIIEDISDKPYVKYGIEVEDIMRKLMILKHPEYEYYYLDNTMLIDNEYDFMTYSPDALIYDKTNNRYGIWECKSANITSYKAKEKWDNESLPENYYTQVLWGLIVTNFDFVELDAELICFDKNNHEYSLIKHYHIERKEVEDDLKYLKEQAIKWWNEYYLKDKEPPLKLKI